MRRLGAANGDTHPDNPGSLASIAAQEQQSLFEQAEQIPGVIDLAKAYGTYAEVYERCLAYLRGYAVRTSVTTKSSSD